MSETTHDLTQRAEEEAQELWAHGQEDHVCFTRYAATLPRFVAAALVQAEQEKAAALDHLELMRVALTDAQGWADKWREEAISQQARLATQEAAIRQVAQAIIAIADQLVNDEPNLARELGGLSDTLRAILPAEQTETTSRSIHMARMTHRAWSEYILGEISTQTHASVEAADVDRVVHFLEDIRKGTSTFPQLFEHLTALHAQYVQRGQS